MLIDRLEPFLNILVLILVEVLELLGLVGFFVQSDRTVAISFPRCICTYCLDLAFGLELCREVVGIVVVRVIWRLVLFIRRGISGMTRYGVILAGARLGRFDSGACSSLSSSDGWGFTRRGCWGVGSLRLAQSLNGICWHSAGKTGHDNGDGDCGWGQAEGEGEKLLVRWYVV